MAEIPEAPIEQRFPFTVESLQAELGHSHQYYLEAIKMVVRIPVVAASVFFALMAAYGFILRVGVEFARHPNSTGMGQLLEMLVWVMPIAGVFVSAAFGLAQFAAVEAMNFSAEVYLTPNRIRLGLPRRGGEGHESYRGYIRTMLLSLFFAGHAISFIIWAVVLVSVLILKVGG